MKNKNWITDMKMFVWYKRFKSLKHSVENKCYFIILVIFLIDLYHPANLTVVGCCQNFNWIHWFDEKGKLPLVVNSQLYWRWNTQWCRVMEIFPFKIQIGYQINKIKVNIPCIKSDSNISVVTAHLKWDIFMFTCKI